MMCADRDAVLHCAVCCGAVVGRVYVYVLCVCADALLEYPPLTVLSNFFVNAANQLRYCAPLSVKSTIAGLAEGALLEVVRKLQSIRGLSYANAGLDSGGSAVGSGGVGGGAGGGGGGGVDPLIQLTRAVRDHCVPFVDALLRQIFRHHTNSTNASAQPPARPHPSRKSTTDRVRWHCRCPDRSARSAGHQCGDRTDFGGGHRCTGACSIAVAVAVACTRSRGGCVRSGCSGSVAGPLAHRHTAARCRGGQRRGLSSALAAVTRLCTPTD
jgi:hypothetical protein